ncbi:MAG: exodeoxyribonuclease VII small subunit [Succinatimonas sp.]|nr:exodeoxyribonuclease VII small subunit [Succinatimonas sp.]
MTESKKGTMSSLEDGLNALESIVTKLESGQMNIDDAIASYTEGMKLAASCKKSLDEMTQKITSAKEEAAKIIGTGDEELSTSEDDFSLNSSEDEDQPPF